MTKLMLETEAKHGNHEQTLDKLCWLVSTVIRGTTSGLHLKSASPSLRRNGIGPHRSGKMATTMYQLVGFILSCLGQFLISSACAMDMWQLQDLSFTLVTSVYTYSGLWQSCVDSSYGTAQCRPFYTIIGLPATLQAVRALMIVGIVLGAIGILISICSLKCIRMGSMEDNAKASMTLTAGIMLVVAGICAIAGASVYANQIVSSFMATTYTNQIGGFNQIGGLNGAIGGNLTPRYTFGPALFIAWVGGAVLLIGGALKCVAYKGLKPDDYKAVAYKASSHNQPIIHNESRLEDGKRDKQYV
ncbi:claudin-18-like [Arapaima gigas]